MKNNKVLLSFLYIFSAVFLFAGSHPNILLNEGFFPFAFFIYLPVLLVVHKNKVKILWLYGFIYGAFAYGIYSFWLKNTYPEFLLVVVLGYGILCSILFMLLKLVDHLFKKNGWFVQALIIASFEYLKTIGFLGLSYGVTVYSQWKNIYLIQICDVIGVYGLNTVIILFTAALFSIIQKLEDIKLLQKNSENNFRNSKINISDYLRNEKNVKLLSIKSSVTVFSFICLLIISFYGYGIWKIHNYREDKTITVAAIQNNENSWLDGIDVYTKNIYRAIQLTEEAFELNEFIDMVVWPETSVVPAIIYNYNAKKDERRYSLIMRLLNYINTKDCIFVVGNDHKVETSNFEKLDYNSALVFEGGKNAIPPQPEIYSKIKLVPFTETFPYQKYFPDLYNILLRQNSLFWEPGIEYKVFNKNGLSFSTLICYEDTFPEISRKMVQNGSRCFVCMSNDSWGKSVVCQNQHLAIALFRSVENRVPSVRSTASGKTCIIDPNGRIIKSCSEFTESFVVGNIPVISNNSQLSVYNKSGDIVIYVVIGLACFLLIIQSLIVIINKIKTAKH